MLLVELATLFQRYRTSANETMACNANDEQKRNS